MLRLILKNLWARRRHNGWLLAELIVVCVVTWVIVDPVVVLTHDRSLPEGFNSDNLYVVKLAELPVGSSFYRAEESDSIQKRANYERIFQRISTYEGVVSATHVLNNLMPYSRSNTTVTLTMDSAMVSTMLIPFVEKSNFFRTFGMEGLEETTADQLDIMTFASDEFVLSGNGEWKTPLTGRIVMDGDSTFIRVAGVLKPIRMASGKQPMTVALNPRKNISPKSLPDNVQILFRSKAGISEEAFLHRFRPWMAKELKAGNLYALSVKPYSTIRADQEFGHGVTNKYRLNLALGIFFLVNLCLGVAGTFWMQTRLRSEEVGIMLSFGASPGHIMRLLMGEGWVLTTLATLIGCFGYFNYAVQEGLYASYMGGAKPSPEYLINNFGFHFLLVSLLVWLILLVVVTIGVYIPARRIARINPVDALRDE